MLDRTCFFHSSKPSSDNEAAAKWPRCFFIFPQMAALLFAMRLGVPGWRAPLQRRCTMRGDAPLRMEAAQQVQAKYQIRRQVQNGYTRASTLVLEVGKRKGRPAQPKQHKTAFRPLRFLLNMRSRQFNLNLPFALQIIRRKDNCRFSYGNQYICPPLVGSNDRRRCAAWRLGNTADLGVYAKG